MIYDLKVALNAARMILNVRPHIKKITLHVFIIIPLRSVVAETHTHKVSRAITPVVIPESHSKPWGLMVLTAHPISPDAISSKTMGKGLNSKPLDLEFIIEVKNRLVVF